VAKEYGPIVIHRSAAAFVLFAICAAPAGADEPWKSYAVKDGVTFEKRPHPGSSFYDYRATTVVAFPPQTVLDAIWSGITQSLPSTVKKREVLAHTDSEFVVYDQIKAPVVSDRDVTIRIRKVQRPDGGALEVHFDSTTDVGPPAAPGHVRIPVVRGQWTIMAAPGGSLLTYSCYSEPGGSIPAFMARGAQQDQVPLDVGRILDRLHALPH
jgi:hypothetical protein